MGYIFQYSAQSLLRNTISLVLQFNSNLLTFIRESESPNLLKLAFLHQT